MPKVPLDLDLDLDFEFISGHEGGYHVLIIVADGQVTDEQETTEALTRNPNTSQTRAKHEPQPQRPLSRVCVIGYYRGLKVSSFHHRCRCWRRSLGPNGGTPDSKLDLPS